MGRRAACGAPWPAPSPSGESPPAGGLQEPDEQGGGDEIRRGPRVETVAVAPEVSVEASCGGQPPRRDDPARPHHGARSRGHRGRRGGAGLSRDQGVRHPGHQLEMRLRDGVEQGQAATERPAQPGEHQVERHREAADVLRRHRVAARGEPHGFEERDRRGEGNRSLVALPEPTRPGEADRPIGPARVVHAQSAQHQGEPAPEPRSSVRPRGRRERREQERHAEVGVGSERRPRWRRPPGTPSDPLAPARRRRPPLRAPAR